MFGEGDPASAFSRPDLFFGRDDEGRNVIERLRRDGRVLLVGPSGCGKSSLVRALVLPALERGPDAMAIAVARPGGRPDAALRAAIAGLDAELGAAIDAYLGAGDRSLARAALVARRGPRCLLYLDQLEEVFLDETADDRAAHAGFFARLGALGHVPGVAILLGMRADFYGDLMRSSAWDDFKDHRVELAPLRGAGLRLAISRPAEMVGVHVEVDLVERLVREADEDRASEALPLLQVALEQLWAQREWRYLSLASFERLADGEPRGLDVVLARHANASIITLDEPSKMLARRALIDLVHLGEGRPDTRRRRLVSELRRAGDDNAALARVLDHLSARRLVVTGAEVEVAVGVEIISLPAGGEPPTAQRHVDLAHDTLITGWPALASWIAARRDDLGTQRRLEARAAGGGLLADSELPEFTRWAEKVATAAGRALGASPALLDLTARSVAAKRRRRQVRRRLIAGAFAALSIAVVTVSILAVNARISSREARNEREAARRQLARNLTSQGQALLLKERRAEAVPFLVAAREAGADDIALRSLFRWAAQGVPQLVLAHTAAVAAVAWSPDGSRLAAGAADGAVRLWDTGTGRELMPALAHPGAVSLMAWSPDGARFAMASDAEARIRESSGQIVALSSSSKLTALAWSPDGLRLLAGDRDGIARVWDARSGRTSAPPLEHRGAIIAIAWGSSGTRAATASSEGEVRVWDPETGASAEPLIHFPGPARTGAWTADGKRLAAMGDGRATVVDPPSVVVWTTPGDQSVESLAWSPDGTRLATGGMLARNSVVMVPAVKVWDIGGLPTAGLAGLPLMQADPIERVSWSPDGTRIAVLGKNSAATILDAQTGAALGPPLEHRDPVGVMVWSSDGTRLATATGREVWIWSVPAAPPLMKKGYDSRSMAAAWSPDGTRLAYADRGPVRIWDARTRRIATPDLTHADIIRQVAWSSDGTRVATASDDKTARVWDAGTGQPITAPLQHDDRVGRVVWSPDGRYLATESGTAARVWDARTGVAASPPLAHPGYVRAIAWSPEGRRLLTASDAAARIWSTATWDPSSPITHDRTIVTAAWRPDGEAIATGNQDGTVHIWNSRTREALTSPLRHRRSIAALSWSPDGTRIATASEDRTARIWDARTGQAVTPFLEHNGEVRAVAWSPDGTRIATGSDDLSRVWDARFGQALTPSLAMRTDWLAWSLDGTHLATAGNGSGHVWDVSWDPADLDAWRATLQRCRFKLNEAGALMPAAAGAR